MAQMADVAREEEAWWEIELGRVAPQLLMPGKPVRGGGRSTWSPTLATKTKTSRGWGTRSGSRVVEGLAIDVTRFGVLAAALQRRLLRHAAEKLGCALDFAGTEALRMLAVTGRAGQRRELADGLRGERTPRELRLTVEASGVGEGGAIPEYLGAVPGEIAGEAFGVRLRVEAAGGAIGAGPKEARLRNWRPGDRVTLRYSSGPRKVKEVLERLKVTGSDRSVWPVLEVEGRIVWMKGVEVQPEAWLVVTAEDRVNNKRDGDRS
jgi:tRNA(Ile)-lysidine synthase